MAYWTYNSRLHSIMALESQWQGIKAARHSASTIKSRKKCMQAHLLAFTAATQFRTSQCQLCLGYIAAHSGLRLPTLTRNQDSPPQTGSRANLI